MYQIRWNDKSARWQATVDSGKTWDNLNSAKKDLMGAAIKEAAKTYGIDESKWSVAEVKTIPQLPV